MKNKADLGGCYPPRSKAEVDNTLLDLLNSSNPRKAAFINCYICVLYFCYNPAYTIIIRFKCNKSK